jgi:SAM-dependent methyltransferase
MVAAVPALEVVAASYDAIATVYGDLFRDNLGTQIADRGLIDMFAEFVQERGTRVADLGCGPGHGTAYLAVKGLDVVGLDLSSAMIDYARRSYEGIDFQLGELSSTGLAGESLDGALAWYSIIHTPPSELGAIFDEFRRILSVGGYLALGFFATDHEAGPPEPFDHKVATAYRLVPGQIEALLTRSGFRTVVSLTRAPGQDERFKRAALIAVRS